MHLRFVLPFRWPTRALLRLALVLGVLLACTEGALAPARVAAVVVSGGGASLRLGEAAQLGVSLKSVEGFTLPTTGVTWTSSDASVATVSPTGQVTALKRGTATITASAFSVTGTASVVVIGVQAVSIPQDTLAVVVQAQGTVTATVTADPGVSVPASWVARDTTVAQVTGAGQITARKLGTTWVVASAEVAADSVRVVVTPVPVTPPASGAAGPVTTSVLGGAVTLTIPPGATTAPALTVAPAPVAPADDRIPAGLTYVFGPAGSQFASPITLSVAYDPAQVPAAKRPLLRLHLVEGSTVTEVAGSAVDLANNRVTAPVSHFSTYAILVPADPSQLAITAGAGQTTFVEYEVPTAPSVTVRDAQGRPVARAKVSFDITAGGGRFRNGATQSSDTATTDANGIATLGARWRLGSSAGANTLTIKVFTAAGAQATTATITATAQANPVARVVVSPDTARLEVNQSQPLSASLYDTRDSVLTGRSVAWTSTTSGVASVSATGLVTAVALGTARIRAVIEGATGEATVIVYRPRAVSVQISPDTGITVVGVSTPYSVTAVDSLGRVITGPAVTWSSSVPGVAAIDLNGMVTPLSAGSTTIEATVDGVTARSTLKVLADVGQAIAGGPAHTCQVRSSGRVFCWGENARGQLGNGTQEKSLRGVRVAGTQVFTQVSAGGFDSRGFSCGLDASGSAYCWGDNHVSELGNGGTTDALTPTLVAGGHRFVQIDSDGYRTCGLTGDGQVYCWGYETTPTLVVSPVRFVMISVGAAFGCGLAPSRKIYCWGAKDEGILGDGGAASHADAREVAGGRYRFLHSGRNHSCAISDAPETEGRVYCWGAGVEGQIGDDNRLSRSVPTLVKTAFRFRSVALSAMTSCGIRESGETMCWGYGPNGELGDASGVSRSAPNDPVATSVRFAHLGAGAYFHCGIDATDQAYCWGWNGGGPLGDGTETSRAAPVPATLAVTSVSVTPLLPYVVVTASRQLTANVTDATGAIVVGRTVTWSSSNPAVATVSATGVVQGVSAGTAVISAVSEGKLGETIVTVSATPGVVVQLSGPSTAGGYYISVTGGSLARPRWIRVPARVTGPTTARVDVPGAATYEVVVHAVRTIVDDGQWVNGDEVVGSGRMQSVVVGATVDAEIGLRASAVAWLNVVVPDTSVAFENIPISAELVDTSGVWSSPNRAELHYSTVPGAQGIPWYPLATQALVKGTMVAPYRTEYFVSATAQTYWSAQTRPMIYESSVFIAHLAESADFPTNTGGSVPAPVLLYIASPARQTTITKAAQGVRFTASLPSGTRALYVEVQRPGAQSLWERSTAIQDGAVAMDVGLPVGGPYTVLLHAADGTYDVGGGYANVTASGKTVVSNVGAGIYSLITPRLTPVTLAALTLPDSAAVGQDVEFSAILDDSSGVWVGSGFSRLTWGAPGSWGCPNAAPASSALTFTSTAVGRWSVRATLAGASSPSTYDWRAVLARQSNYLPYSCFGMTPGPFLLIGGPTFGIAARSIRFYAP
jgi:uncharacterized protein YjdB